MNMKVQGLYMSWTGFHLTVDRAVADSHTIRDLSTLDQSALRDRGPSPVTSFLKMLG